jgi:hypothetical protein
LRIIDWQVVDADLLPSVAAEWDHLVAMAGYPPFLQTAFLRHLLDVFGSGDERLALGRRNGQLIAGTLLSRPAPGQWSTFQPSQLPLGPWIMAPGQDLQQLIGSLLAELPGVALSLGLTQLDPRFDPRPMTGGRFESIDYVPTGWVDIAGEFDDYWEARGKNLRQNLRKHRRKLEEQGAALRFDVLEAPEDVDRAFLAFAQLESIGWKAGEGTAISVDNRQGLFYRAMLAEFASQHRAIAFVLSLDDRPLAVDFGVRDAAALVVLKTTYDESFKAYSPAQLLHEKLFEWAFRNRAVQRVEFYGRMMEWHTRWTEQSRMLFHVSCFRWAFLRSGRLALRRARAQLADSPR